jgi:hypothetical protein
MTFHTCFDWFKKLRLFVNERNLKIDVVLKASFHKYLCNELFTGDVIYFRGLFNPLYLLEETR